MSRLKLLTLAFVLSLLFVAANVFAQQSGAGSMSGTVVDESGQVVPGADIVITNESTGETRSGVSNDVGVYNFQGLQAGPYTVRAQLTGFKPYEIKNTMVLPNNRLSVAPLRLEVGTLSETVSVSAKGETIATTVTSHQAIIDSKAMLELSVRGRDPITTLKIMPGVGLLATDQEPSAAAGGRTFRTFRVAPGRPSTLTASTAEMAVAAACSAAQPTWTPLSR